MCSVCVRDVDAFIRFYVFDHSNRKFQSLSLGNGSTSVYISKISRGEYTPTIYHSQRLYAFLLVLFSSIM